MRPLVRIVQRAFTLVELMVVIALVGVIVMLAAPQMNEMIGMQRLRAISDQVVSDFHYMRGEAVSRNQFMGYSMRNVSTEPMSCYVIFSNSTDPLNSTALAPTACTCTNAVGSVCTGTQRELRTVQVPRDQSIELILRVPTAQPQWLILSPVNGGAEFVPVDTAEIAGSEFCVEVRRTPRGRLRTGISRTGRSTVCSPDGSVPGVATCPPFDAVTRNCPLAP